MPGPRCELRSGLALRHRRTDTRRCRTHGIPAPAARIRSAIVPCGTNSTSSSPTETAPRTCSSHRNTTTPSSPPGRSPTGSLTEIVNTTIVRNDHQPDADLLPQSRDQTLRSRHTQTHRTTSDAPSSISATACAKLPRTLAAGSWAPQGSPTCLPSALSARATLLPPGMALIRRRVGESPRPRSLALSGSARPSRTGPSPLRELADQLSCMAHLAFSSLAGGTPCRAS